MIDANECEHINIIFVLMWIQLIFILGEKRQEAVNVQVVRGKTTTFIHLDDEEAKKVWTHGDAALKKVQQVHKSVIWNFFVGRASLDVIQKVKKHLQLFSVYTLY